MDIQHVKIVNHDDIIKLNEAIYVIGGSWSLNIIIALSEGNKRFKELQRRVEGISAKVLSNELKDLEENEFLIRNVHHTNRVVVDYK